MTRTRSNRLAALALLSAVALAGCGGDDDGKTTSAASATPLPSTTMADGAPGGPPTKSELKAAKTEDGQWAKEMCQVVQRQADPVQPPDANNKDPKVVTQSLGKFFGDVADQLNDQAVGLEKVGPPPSTSAQADWDKAVDKVKSVQRKVSKLSKQFSEADPSNQAELDALMKQMGDEMKSMITYEGPVAQLLKNKSISKAVLGNPDCRQIAGMAVR